MTLFKEKISIHFNVENSWWPFSVVDRLFAFLSGWSGLSLLSEMWYIPYNFITLFLTKTRGVLPPETMMHFPPYFRFPSLFSKNFQTLWKIFELLPFPEKISRFSSAKISDNLFLVTDHKFQIAPLFCLFQYISPLFRENYYFPLLWKISPLF